MAPSPFGAGAQTAAGPRRQQLTASDGAKNDYFGSAIAPDGDRVLVGALQKDSAAGAAYLFRRDAATGQWTEETRLQVRPPTNFAGPHLVQTALDRGHQVTLFNRGRTNPHLFPELEKLRGDRYAGRDGGLAALDTSRVWDVVIDTWQEAPGCVDLTTRKLAGRTERYVYISSIATYRGFRELGITEDGPIRHGAHRVVRPGARLQNAQAGRRASRRAPVR